MDWWPSSKKLIIGYCTLHRFMPNEESEKDINEPLSKLTASSKRREELWKKTPCTFLFLQTRNSRLVPSNAVTSNKPTEKWRLSDLRRSSFWLFWPGASALSTSKSAGLDLLHLRSNTHRGVCHWSLVSTCVTRNAHNFLLHVIMHEIAKRRCQTGECDMHEPNLREKHWEELWCGWWNYFLPILMDNFAAWICQSWWKNLFYGWILILPRLKPQ